MRKDLSEITAWLCPTKKEMGVFGHCIKSMIFFFYEGRLNKKKLTLNEAISKFVLKLLQLQEEKR